MMADYDSSEALETLEFESEFESDSDSSERRGRWSPPSRATGRGLYTPRPSTNAVTQAQMQAAMSRVGDQMRRNSAAITTVNGRVNTVNAAEKRDNEDRKKDLKGINEKIQLLALLPLLVKPSSSPVDQTNTPLQDASGKPIAQVVTPDASSMNMLLPLLLISGLGSGGGTGLGGEGGSDNSMLLLAMVLAFSKP